MASQCELCRVSTGGNPKINRRLTLFTLYVEKSGAVLWQSEVREKSKGKANKPTQE